MTKQEKEISQEEAENLQTQVRLFQDLHNLQNEPYFRQQLMITLERIALALEKVAEDPETPSSEEKEEPEEDEEDEEDEWEEPKKKKKK